MSWEPPPRAAFNPNRKHTTLTAYNDIFWHNYYLLHISIGVSAYFRIAHTKYVVVS